MYNMEISVGSYKFRVEILIGLVVVFWILFGHLLCGCCRVNLLEGLPNVARRVSALRNSSIYNKELTEGFTGANKTEMGPEFSEAKSPGYILNPSTWSLPSLTYSPGTTPSAGVKNIWDREKQPIPLPEGQLDMLATTPFKPECCPNAYSSSTGCACMTMEQYGYLKQRGSNNVPYSEY